MIDYYLEQTGTYSCFVFSTIGDESEDSSSESPSYPFLETSRIEPGSLSINPFNDSLLDKCSETNSEK